ncbi:hypothetical protein [Tenacibaculum sp. 190524A05c]|uniref:hypothetical protein n=1 Tax=Tenacibaculum platacis TaxID=3137852 RepID=UPI0031FB9533
MAGFIYFKEYEVIFNNRQFSSTITFVSEVARKLATENEMKYVKKMENNVENYWPGMCLDIETDFPELEERKFWSKMFYETAREIFERKIGVQDYFFWQTQRIYQIYGTGKVFEKAVKEVEPKWMPDIRDYREFDEWTNKRNKE